MNEKAYIVGYRHGYYAPTSYVAQYNQKLYDKHTESYERGFADGKARRPMLVGSIEEVK